MEIYGHYGARYEIPAWAELSYYRFVERKKDELSYQAKLNGWIIISLDKPHYLENEEQIIVWLESHCQKGRFFIRFNQIFIRDKPIAVLFKLTWG